MGQSVRSEDIELYRRALTEISDAEQRQVLLILLLLLTEDDRAVHDVVDGPSIA